MQKLNHVLIINDDSINNLFSRIILEDSGISDRITICQSVPEALHFLQNMHTDSNTLFPDLILLDISMQAHDSFDFLDAYYALNYHTTHNTLISMLTTSLHEESIQKSQQYDVVIGYMKKPLAVTALYTLLSSRRSISLVNNFK